MINKIENWIDETLKDHLDKRVSCECFATAFNGFYPVAFLSRSYYVVVDEIPKPDFTELRQAGLGDFMDMPVDGITYKDTYFILKGCEDNLELHFHELVHVLQWETLGASNFISRYIEEVKQHGYEGSPLEKMAYALQYSFANKVHPFSVPDYVNINI
ncbi:MAG: hypothetical protein COC14_00175 [Burkholderiaceae bacterium]|nr:MAG: hypothetical protein COC14_00175 [Burkholderiaceae bacterium]